MFVSGLDKKYDLENDYQRALFFRECLKELFVFEEDISSTWAAPGLGSAGRRGHTYEVKKIKCCWNFGRSFGRQISLNRFMYEVLVQLPLFVKSNKLPPAKSSPDTFKHFVKHFSTEENILKTLDHLSIIMKVERQSGVFELDEDYDYSFSTMGMD